MHKDVSCPGRKIKVMCTCLENPMDRGAWQATVHRVAQIQTLLSTHTHICTINLHHFDSHKSETVLISHVIVLFPPAGRIGRQNSYGWSTADSTVINLHIQITWYN